MITKQCFKCKEVKPITEFRQYLSGINQGLFHSYCRDCEVVYKDERARAWDRTIIRCPLSGALLSAERVRADAAPPAFCLGLKEAGSPERVLGYSMDELREGLSFAKARGWMPEKSIDDARGKSWGAEKQLPDEIPVGQIADPNSVNAVLAKAINGILTFLKKKG